MILELHSVSAGYGDSIALRDCDLSVEEGSIVAVVGSNGAGKTTLLRTIAGLLWPTGGTIEFDGEDVTRALVHDRVRRGIVLLPETRELFWGMSVRKNLQLGALARRDAARAQADLENALTYFPRLRDRMEQRAGSMSGGEQQMLAVARALMTRPRIFLLDEPSLGLSPIATQSLFALLATLRRDLGLTIVLAEQNTNMALRIADAVFALNLGTIVTRGTPDEFRKNRSTQSLFLGT